MATVVLTAIGNLWGGPAGGAIGGLIGSYIDNQVLFKENKDPQPLQDLLMSNASEGGPALSLVGQECRVLGQVVFLSTIYTHAGQPAVDVAIAFANDGKPINDVARIYAEGFEIYNASGSLSVSSSQFTINQLGGSAPDPAKVSSIIHPPSSTIDLTKFRIGIADSLTMNGWADAGNNWGFGGGTAGNNKGAVVRLFRWPDGHTQIEATRRDAHLTPPVIQNEGPLTTPVTISQTFPPLNTAFASAIQIQKGLPGQTTSATGTIRKWYADAPELELTAWVGLRDFKTQQFGSRLPQVVGIIEESATPVTIAQCIDKIFTTAGWVKGTSLSWNTDALDATKFVRGYTMREEGSLVDRMRALVYAYDLAIQIRDGEVYFFHPEDARVWTVPAEDWGASASEPDSGLEFSPTAPSNAPSKVEVHYVDREANWEDASVERHIHTSNVKSADTLEIDLRSLTLSMPDAVEIAQRLLWRPHREGRKFRGKLPPRYWFVLENDLIETTFNGRTIQLAVQKKDRGQDRMVEVEGHVFEPDPRATGGIY